MKLRHSDISIPAAGVWLEGHMAYAPNVRGLVVIVQPDAGRARGKREVPFADPLQQSDFATLSMDLLTPQEEERDTDAYYNIPQMANRLVAIADWVSHQPTMTTLPIGLIGMHTACAAAVRAASKAPASFGAIVCCGGRPDLAGAGPLQALECPIRIIVGGLDPEREILWQAYTHIRTTRDWQLVENADATFNHPVTMARFADLARDWLYRMLPERRKVTSSPLPTPDDPL